jgi:CYTH domain-containing protein
VRKLGQKVRLDQDHPSTVEHTTLYLDDAEAAALLVLPAHALAKTRTLLAWERLTLAVDVFVGPLTGLVLAEVDLGEADLLPAAEPPLAWLAEVTEDERFTGGHLARTSATKLIALLNEFGAATVQP